MKQIVIRTSFPATHNYPEHSGYLKHEHRHLFYVTMKWAVYHNNREIEFIRRKEEVENYIDNTFRNTFLGKMSCEDIAENLMKEFNANFVSVFEDNENGVEIG